MVNSPISSRLDAGHLTLAAVRVLVEACAVPVQEQPWMSPQQITVG